jgi:hypothetical protein
MGWTIYKPFWDNWINVERVGGEFLYRMLVLTIAALRSSGERTARLNAHCNGAMIKQFREFTGTEGLSELANAQVKLVSGCSETCLKEARNATQAVLLTQEELGIWNTRMLASWYG